MDFDQRALIHPHFYVRESHSSTFYAEVPCYAICDHCAFFIFRENSLLFGRLTAKCDVYSFGVVLLELLTGHRAFDETRVSAEQKLVDWVRPQLRDKRKLYRIMDTKLEAQYPRKGAYVAATLALHCVNIDARARPPMADVLAILEKLPSPKFMAIHSPSEQKNEV
ncbi:unnamed protein product [Ilex paraguariensis]|uniref:Protein kinase domain-containing protein n=1 Tax=Ilex paraguariensis TaxID=185542 RepID=A0ABC8SG35_9AQUA